MKSKQFKCQASQKNGREVTALFIARDGECWEILFADDEDANIDESKVYEISYRRSADGPVLDWDTFGADPLRQLKLDSPYDVVKRLWGEDVANEEFGGEPVRVPKRRRSLDRETATETKVDEGPFEASHFVPTKLNTAIEKARIANSIVAFFHGNCEYPLFSQAVYANLTSMFRIPAGSSRKACYDKFFSDAKGKHAIVSHMAAIVPIGPPEEGWSDVTRGIRSYVVQVIRPRFNKSLGIVLKMEERKQLEDLILKHGIPEGLRLPWQPKV